MTKRLSHTKCFEHFGTKPHNVQWSWSAKSADGNTVVVTLWQDMFQYRDRQLVYTRPGFDPDAPDTRPGFRELMANLSWARDYCDGRFRVIVAIAKDKDAHPRSIRECFPHEKLVMRLTHLDVETGAFSAESVSG